MENMIQTYQGYFKEDGRFIPDSLLVNLPARRRAIVNILEEEVVEKKTKSQKQLEALDRLLVGLAAIDDEPFDEEFDAIINQGVNFSRELDL
jgi:hypothetical protein